MNIAPQISAVGPLAGLSVVELGDGTAGPYAAKLLGDFGGEVVKIEGPEGDSTRRRGPFPDGRPDPEASGLFLYLNINKRGVVLDINSEDGRHALDRLLAPADIFITNLPTGAPAGSWCRAGRASCAVSAADRDHHHAVRVERPVGRTARR